MTKPNAKTRKQDENLGTFVRKPINRGKLRLLLTKVEECSSSVLNLEPIFSQIDEI